MKPTQEQILQWAREAGFEDYDSTSLSGHSDLDETLQVGEYPIGESVFLLAAIAYEAGRKDENEAAIEDARTVGGEAGAEMEKLIRARREQ